jgi:hypothetical protein
MLGYRRFWSHGWAVPALEHPSRAALTFVTFLATFLELWIRIAEDTVRHNAPTGKARVHKHILQ